MPNGLERSISPGRRPDWALGGWCEGAAPYWFGKLDLAGAQADFDAGDVHVDHLLLVDPRFDALIGDAQPQRVPAAPGEILSAGRLVLRGVVAVQAREADH